MDVGRLTGAFDLVTVAQLDVIEQARGRCDRLVARVHTDEQVRRIEGLAPVMPLDERMSLVAALRAVDDVDVTTDLTADDLPDQPGRGLAYVFADAASPTQGEVLRPRTEGWLLPVVPDFLVRTDATDAGTRTGYVPGGWDMFHIGHLRILERARAQCDRLVVGVVTDEALVAAKGRSPMVPFAQRAAVVAAVGLVDEVVADSSSNKLLAWERVGFDVLFKGDDWRGTAKGDRLEAEMAQVGVDLRYFPYTPHTSSTALRSVLDAR
ncbi:MAG: adenylyltransferase/cytidyltransferase family protein [Janthinobacterium lividum]